ncbi:YicC/YloC family endoribonuclease [Palleronia caenipelagi]|uniref:YicC family protein n=1 Tax=Palleronia caenipelagi TaxID=2489174 RepID=A0A547Q605_9RHOB|nr:YicC/YloC family endoribonuclease [Palleronia caenipelagi]TRD21813.1 YicC family protein [Palleronia caenipelagi]
MTQSMTAYTTATGTLASWSWQWELRSVNGKGLDLRLRLPDMMQPLGPDLRRLIGAQVSRGNLSLSLKLDRNAGEGDVDPAALDRIAAVEAAAAARGLILRPSSAVEILSLREGADSVSEDDANVLSQTLLKQFENKILPAFIAARVAEGQALIAILDARVDEIDTLVTRVSDAVAARQDRQREILREQIARLRDLSDTDPDRLAQELAMLAIRHDVTEELDRLHTHVTAARDLLAKDGPKGKRLDFLMQEFNREANTLCSKSQDSALAAIGLDLKTVIDQLREQVQNLE